ncbi:Uma2 family endonuclease [Planotetraspora phitsanulokensis]|uniref:Putative restriction endonuclease domain-containing protein n=1 Tax=Planotetraspora phitsanulokensis TaxID=575192 RepID=A0A8J3U8M6_9ACTN|nr:Uma2 family endonuclease [Planotetraspora phitsanulokensis]GII40091.1 hypothetical protein Pph01_50940 [Planotetraspora phitsanulokensis]
MTTNGDGDDATLRDVTSVLDDWPYPPPGGWTADDLDRLPLDGPNGELDFFKHVELVDGALIFTSPQKRFHERVVFGLRTVLNEQVPGGFAAVSQMDVKLGLRQRPYPDVSLVEAAAAADDARTFYVPEEVHLVIEVVSPESEYRDREIKPQRYAAAGIPHFWRVENDDNRPVVYVYEIDPATRAYAVTGIYHARLAVEVPFTIAADLDALPR